MSTGITSLMRLSELAEWLTHLPYLGFVHLDEKVAAVMMPEMTLIQSED
jgi:hypothetical protein